LRIRALVENKRPTADTKLAVAPFWNLSHDGSVCTGSMRRPDSASVAAIASWEQGFYQSNYASCGVHAGRISIDTRQVGGRSKKKRQKKARASTRPLFERT
jgi:PRTRC genetic system protein B